MTIQPLSPRPREIGVTEPIDPALELVKRMLFRPFDLSKWIIIGFCAWLAGLGESGGGGFTGFNNDFTDHGHNHQGADQIRELFHKTQDFVLANLDWILPLGVFLVSVVLAIWLVVLWLNSRGKFMLLHCVALNQAEVEAPWCRYAAQGNSLFWFRLVVGLVGMVLTLPLVLFLVIDIVRMATLGAVDVAGILAALGLVLALVVVGIPLALVHEFTADFVAPIMYLRGSKCTAAWGEFWRLLTSHPGKFALYILFQIVLGLVIGALVVAAVLITCCTAACFLMIPFVGTVLLLPILIFKRAYSLFYLAQFGPEYDVFPQPPVAAEPAATPPDAAIPPIGPVGP